MLRPKPLLLDIEYKSEKGITLESDSYDDFAWIYNEHWGSYINQVTAILDELMLSKLPTGARILDLCCGTGQLAQELVDQGFVVTGLDISEGMLRFAREHAPDTEFIRGDARSFSLPLAFDGIVSTYDSLNHIMSIEELIDVFDNVYRALRGGGLFLFDLNTEAGYENHWEGGAFDIVEDDHVCIVRSIYDPDERIAQFDATIFILEREWKRSDLTFFQRCYSQMQVADALESAGFVNIDISAYDGEFGLTELTDETERLYFVCRKPL
ncbi:MAG: class I SAM-dependent methyltransferase [Chloroflexota bacterium]|nr:class I SAM-dependent methyltransferase [Chloroflexota bacterium]